MSDRKKVWLGVLSFLPILTGVFLLLLAPTIMHRLVNDSDGLPSITKFYLVFGPINLIVIVVTIALLVFDIRLVTQGETPDDQKTLWIVFLLLGTLIAFPIFWYFKIWRPKIVVA